MAKLVVEEKVTGGTNVVVEIVVVAVVNVKVTGGGGAK